MNDIAERYLIAKKYFQKHWRSYSDHADDFASFCAEKWLSGAYHKALYRHIAIDFMRTYFGRPGHRSEIMLRSERGGAWEMESQSYELPTLVSLDGLSQQERVATVLYYKWGFEMSEIAEVLGVSESRISQVCSQSIKKLKGAQEMSPSLPTPQDEQN